MRKNIILLIVLLIFAGCAPKLGPDPFKGTVTVQDNLEGKIKEAAGGNCTVENIIKQQMNLQLFEIAQKVCANKTPQPLMFNLSEMVYCVYLAAKYHELEPVECKSEEKEDD